MHRARLRSPVLAFVGLAVSLWLSLAGAGGAPVRFVGRVPPPPPPPGSGGVAGLEAPERDDLGFANLGAGPKAKAAASSCLPGYAIHQVAHLNDGRLGNSHSWISNGEPSWAEIDLGGVYWVWKAAFGSDSSRRYRDRAAAAFSILTAVERGTWHAVYRHDGEPVHERTAFRFRPVRARYVRVAVTASSGGEVRIDELEVYGQEAPIPSERLPELPAPSIEHPASSIQDRLRYAFLGEEHAWLKAYGRADLSPRLVPYNGRVQRYPRHVGDDRLPLPPLPSAPTLDGRLDDACWRGASRGVARVAHPYDWEAGPLVEHAVWAGVHENDLCLGIAMNRILSSYLAVVSSADGGGCGVVALTKQGLVFTSHVPAGRRGVGTTASSPIEGQHNESRTVFELRLPLALFPKWREMGLRVGLGLGGKHTAAVGRPVHFSSAPLAIAQAGPCVNRELSVRLVAGDRAVTVSGDVPALGGGLALAPGQQKVLAVRADRGPIGPERELALRDDGGGAYRLHLLRYSPLDRVLTLFDALIARAAARGLSVSAERDELKRLRTRQATLLAGPPDLAAERQAFFDARVARRRLFFREPALEPLGRVLFCKRHAFEPSHNYSVLLDSRYRGGGGLYTLTVPRRDGRLEPAEAKLARLFDSGEGIARNPMADFDLEWIYFAWRRSAADSYHLFRIRPDGSGLEQLTRGPSHDFFPCPLPDGGIAFMSTRVKARYLCWRPQAFVLYRMEPDGSGLRQLSFANLSEWAPSVTRDGRILWTRSEYVDKGADFSHTLWTIRPDGTQPRLVFGNTIIQPNGYANGREVPGTNEVCCVLISHFGDLNGPVALLDLDKGRFNPDAIRSLTPEVPWPGMWPREEYFREPVPVSRDHFLVSHAPRDRAGLYVIDRYGNREVLHQDPRLGCMQPTLLRREPRPVTSPDLVAGQEAKGHLVVTDVYRGIEDAVARGRVKYLRVACEVKGDLERLPDGSCRHDHPDFQKWYAAPTDRVRGPYGWPSYVAKASLGLVPVEPDGSASFTAPAGKVLYFQALDADFNELQRMRSVVQLQPGETRSCIGCHENRSEAPPVQVPVAFQHPPRELQAPPWGTEPFDYQKVVQPIWDAHCVRCHDGAHKRKIDLTGHLDADRIPTSYKTLIRQGLVHLFDYGYNSGGNAKAAPLTFGVLKSKLVKTLEGGHSRVKLSQDEMRAVKCWIDFNCPLWPDYQFRPRRPARRLAASPGRRDEGRGARDE